MTPKSIRLATWILEHLTVGLDGRTLAGDLLEEVQCGRSALWYWHQVMASVATGGWIATREKISIGVFSVAWSLLYPMWQSIPFASASRRPLEMIWPYTPIMELAWGLVPAIAFVWLGLAIYLLARRKNVSQCFGAPLLQGLSMSVSMLLLAALGTFFYLKQPDVSRVMEPDFFSNFQLAGIRLSIAVSVAVAIIAVLPASRRHSSSVAPSALR